MSRDLDEQLEELGTDYRRVVGRLRAAYEPAGDMAESQSCGRGRDLPFGRRSHRPDVTLRRGNGRWPAAALLAASLLLVVGLATLFSRDGREGLPVSDGRGTIPGAAPTAGIVSAAPPPSTRAPRDYRLAGLHDASSIREIVATQKADGSWANDFLTRQNAVALKSASTPEARIAYKKAMRNLRTRGLL